MQALRRASAWAIRLGQRSRSWAGNPVSRGGRAANICADMTCRCVLRGLSSEQIDEVAQATRPADRRRGSVDGWALTRRLS
jgi:hypothetical protein